MPALGVASYIRLRRGKPLPPKERRYRGMIAFQLLLLLITLMAARQAGIPLLGGSFPGPSAWVVAGGYLVLIAWRLRRAWPKLSPERMARARILLPDHPAQMRKWVVISALAGITEECAYRGLAFRLLTQNGGTVWIALLVCVASFGIAHMTQGGRGVLGSSLIAMVMHGIVFLTQSLYLVMVVHAVYDLIVGVIAMPILSQFAKTQELSPAPEASQ